jgi:hypothetical protein
LHSFIRPFAFDTTSAFMSFVVLGDFLLQVYKTLNLLCPPMRDEREYGTV